MWCSSSPLTLQGVQCTIIITTQCAKLSIKLCTHHHHLTIYKIQVCTYLLIFASIFLVIVTLPLSLCLIIKVNSLVRTSPRSIPTANTIKGCARLRAGRHLPPWTDPWWRRQVFEQTMIFVLALFDLWSKSQDYTALQSCIVLVTIREMSPGVQAFSLCCPVQIFTRSLICGFVFQSNSGLITSCST